MLFHTTALRAYLVWTACQLWNALEKLTSSYSHRFRIRKIVLKLSHHLSQLRRPFDDYLVKGLKRASSLAARGLPRDPRVR